MPVVRAQWIVSYLLIAWPSVIGCGSGDCGDKCDPEPGCPIIGTADEYTSSKLDELIEAYAVSGSPWEATLDCSGRPEKLVLVEYSPVGREHINVYRGEIEGAYYDQCPAATVEHPMTVMIDGEKRAGLGQGELGVTGNPTEMYFMFQPNLTVLAFPTGSEGRVVIDSRGCEGGARFSTELDTAE